MSAIDPPEKKKHGCFFYGIIVLLIMVFLFAVGAFFVGQYVVNMANAKIAQYTDTQPLTFPKEEMPKAELDKLQQRVGVFTGAMDAHSNSAPLVLSSQDINALLGSLTNFQNLKDMCHVEVEDDKIKGEVSLPLEKFFRIPFVHTKGRYLNGVGTFRLGVTNQNLAVYVQTLQVNGKPLPPEFMMQLQGKDMAEDFNNNPTNAPAPPGRYDSVEVKGGKITLKAKEN